MNGTAVIRFDEARCRVLEFVAERVIGAYNVDPIVVADLYGMMRLAVDDVADTSEGIRQLRAQRDDVAMGFAQAAASYAPNSAGKGVLLFASEMFAPVEVFGRTDVLTLSHGPRRVRWADNCVMGQTWLDLPARPSISPVGSKRVTFFGLKGGLGRSTAATVWAMHLARQGRRVLVVDLDLESPGLSSSLLPHERHPEYGVVDWFVEDPVHQADRELLVSMVERSPLAEGMKGELFVVPAGGRARSGYTYMPKLGRTYLTLTHADAKVRREHFAARLARFIDEIEQLDDLKPEVTILDSRAGLHDIAGVLVTDIGATSLLFAADTQQTWDGYGILFDNWREHYERALRFREDLHLVAAQVPEVDSVAYLKRFTNKAYRLFSDNLYEDAEGGELDAFNYAEDDETAPHAPLPIFWGRALQHFDPVHAADRVSMPQVDSLVEGFIERLDELVFQEKG